MYHDVPFSDWDWDTLPEACKNTLTFHYNERTGENIFHEEQSSDGSDANVYEGDSHFQSDSDAGTSDDYGLDDIFYS